jgi:hypothetical protein
MARDPHAASAVPQPEQLRANGWQAHALGSDARDEGPVMLRVASA